MRSLSKHAGTVASAEAYELERYAPVEGTSIANYMSEHPSSSTKRNKVQKRNPNVHTVEQNLAEALELELLASEAYERSDYLHMAYSNY